MLVNKNKHNAINLNLHLMQFEVFLSRDDRESKKITTILVRPISSQQKSFYKNRDS